MRAVLLALVLSSSCVYEYGYDDEPDAGCEPLRICADWYDEQGNKAFECRAFDRCCADMRADGLGK